MSLVLRLVSTLLPMLLAQVFLHATGPLAFFYGYLAAGCFIPLVPLAYRKAASLVFFSLGACIGLTLIVIQPLSGFLVWFDLVPQDAMRGPVSVVFMYIGGYLSLIAVYGMGTGTRLISLMRLLFVNVLLAFIIVRLGWLLVLAAILLPGLVALALSGRPVPLHRWRVLASLAGLGLIAGLTTLATVPGQVPAGIFLIDEYLSGFLRTGVFRLLPEFPVLYGFSGYGHGFSQEKLGDKPLLSERALFAVEGQPGSTHYLRTNAFDMFTGKGWILSEKALSPGESDFQTTGQLPAYQEGRTLLGMRLLMDYYPLVPQILGATTVVSGRTGDGLLFDGNPATGLTLARPLLYGERLTVVSAMDPVVGSAGGFIVDSVVSSVGSSVPTAGATAGANDPGLYLSVPDDLPPVARQLAASLHGLPEAELPGALARLLDDGFTYSLDPPDRPGRGNQRGEGETPGAEGQPASVDFLQHFLTESRTGYCVHFASAAVALARLAGVPARYVTGFMVSLPRPDDDSLTAGSGGLVRAEITGLNSHAWVELWLPSAGWISFEATPPMRQEPAGTAGIRTSKASLDDFTLRQLAAITGGRVDLRGTAGTGSGCAIPPARIAVVLLACVLAVLAGAGLYPFARQSDWHPGERSGWLLWTDFGSWWKNRIAWRAGGPGLADFRKKAKRVVRLSSGWGVPGPERSGWLTWENGVAAVLARHGVNFDAPDLTRADMEVFREVFFGGRLLESQDFIRINKLARQLRDLSKRQPSATPAD